MNLAVHLPGFLRNLRVYLKPAIIISGEVVFLQGPKTTRYVKANNEHEKHGFL